MRHQNTQNPIHKQCKPYKPWLIFLLMCFLVSYNICMICMNTNTVKEICPAILVKNNNDKKKTPKISNDEYFYDLPHKTYINLIHSENFTPILCLIGHQKRVKTPISYSRIVFNNSKLKSKQKFDLQFCCNSHQ